MNPYFLGHFRVDFNLPLSMTRQLAIQTETIVALSQNINKRHKLGRFEYMGCSFRCWLSSRICLTQQTYLYAPALPLFNSDRSNKSPFTTLMISNIRTN